MLNLVIRAPNLKRSEKKTRTAHKQPPDVSMQTNKEHKIHIYIWIKHEVYCMYATHSAWKFKHIFVFE